MLLPYVCKCNKLGFNWGQNWSLLNFWIIEGFHAYLHSKNKAATFRW